MPNYTVSRYRKTIQKFTDARLERVTIPPTVRFKQRYSREGEDWRQIAKTELGDAQYYWVLCELNGILNPYDKLPAGKLIIIPDADIIQNLR